MAIVRYTQTQCELNREKLLADLEARPQPSEGQIEQWAAEDSGAFTDQDLAEMAPVYPPQKAEQIRELRSRTGLSQPQFALMFGFNIDTLQ